MGEATKASEMSPFSPRTGSIISCCSLERTNRCEWLHLDAFDFYIGLLENFVIERCLKRKFSCLYFTSWNKEPSWTDQSFLKARNEVEELLFLYWKTITFEYRDFYNLSDVANDHKIGNINVRICLGTVRRLKACLRGHQIGFSTNFYG